MRNKTTLWIIVSFIAVALLVVSTTAQAQTETPETPTPQNQEPRTLAVNGNGIITLEPDIAYIQIGVQTESENAQDAVASNNRQSQQLLSALTRAGVAEDDVKTTNFSIYPRQEWDNEGQPTGITYVVNNTVSVTVRDLEQIGTLLDATVQAGANRISGIQFDVEDREAAQQQAMTAAVENARARAEVLAQAAGVTLGDVLSIESYFYGGTPIPYERNVVMADSAAGMEVPVSPGEMQINADVNIVYEIE
jgi:uncharacterized protein YggE